MSIVRRKVGKKAAPQVAAAAAEEEVVTTAAAEETVEEAKPVRRGIRKPVAPVVEQEEEQEEDLGEEEQEEEEQEEEVVAPKKVVVKKAAPAPAPKKAAPAAAPKKAVVKKTAPVEQEEQEEDDTGKGAFGFQKHRQAAPKKELQPGDRMPLERFYDLLLANFAKQLPEAGMTKKTEAKAVLEVVEGTLAEVLANHSMKFLNTMFKTVTNGARLSKVPSEPGRYTLVPEHQALKMVSIRLTDVPNIDVFAEETEEGTVYTAGTWDPSANGGKGGIVEDEAFQQQLDAYLGLDAE